MNDRSAEQMRPQEILRARDASGCAFVPVSPAFEWHGVHLPMGTDALVAEELCRRVARGVEGVWFRALSLGLDAWRGPDELRAWGFGPEERVFGMRFPDLPLNSEYVDAEPMRQIVAARLEGVRACGFRHAFLVNHHGGRGQNALLDALAVEHTAEGFAVHSVRTYQFNTIRHPSLRVGGHAGLSETTWVMAFRPDLVDLAAQAEGELSVRHSGILHDEPTIPEPYNPRNAHKVLADELRHAVVEGFVRHVRQQAGL